MPSNYRKLGQFIRPVNRRDTDESVTLLLGVSIQKKFIPSIANTIGTDMSTYKIIQRNQFAYGPVTSRNGDRISIALLEDYAEAIVSQAYTCFTVLDENELLPQYLMMWFRRPEFDRYARFMSHGSAREIFSWDELCNTELPVPAPEKQREIVAEYHTIQNRITLNNQLILTLETTAQAIYKQWFVEFEFPNEAGQPYKSSGGELVDSELGEIPKGWEATKLNALVKTQYGFTASASSENIGPKFLRITDIAQRQIFWDDVPFCHVSKIDLARYTLKEGDIVVARTGAGVGIAKRINKLHPEAVFASYLVRLTATTKAMTYYLGIILESANYRDYILSNAEGSAQPQANAVLLASYSVIEPEIEIILKFNKVIGPVSDTVELMRVENEKLLELKSLLLSKLATIESPTPAPAAPQPAQLTLAFA